MEIKDIMKILPHRYPFLLVDRILEVENDKRVVGIKNVTINEPFFHGHFPHTPIMPGVLIVEAMAQVGAIMLLNTRLDKRMIPYLAGIEKLRFRRPVHPGDQLVIEMEIVGIKSGMGKMKGRARVKDTTVVEGEILFALVPEKEGVK